MQGESVDISIINFMPARPISNRLDELAHKIGVEVYDDPKKTPSRQFMAAQIGDWN